MKLSLPGLLNISVMPSELWFSPALAFRRKAASPPSEIHSPACGKYEPAQLATVAAFRKDPALVWGWYEWRRALVAKARPNKAHCVIAALERLVPELLVVTQSVDDAPQACG